MKDFLVTKKEIRGWELVELHLYGEEADNGSSQGRKIIGINSIPHAPTRSKDDVCEEDV